MGPRFGPFGCQKRLPRSSLIILAWSTARETLWGPRSGRFFKLEVVFGLSCKVTRTATGMLDRRLGVGLSPWGSVCQLVGLWVQVARAGWPKRQTLNKKENETTVPEPNQLKYRPSGDKPTPGRLSSVPVAVIVPLQLNPNTIFNHEKLPDLGPRSVF